VLSEDDDVVEAFTPDATDESLAYGVHQRRPHRRSHDANSDACRNAIEARSELVVTIANEHVRPDPERGRIA
jgi:hypothetical protein